MAKEAKARILINDLLRRSGWRFFDDESGPPNISLETHVKLKKKILADLGDDFEKTAHGFYWFLTFTASYWKQARLLAAGGGQPQFNGNSITKVEIPLPPLEVQEKIVEELDGYRKQIEEHKNVIEGLESKIKDRIAKVWEE